MCVLIGIYSIFFSFFSFFVLESVRGGECEVAVQTGLTREASIGVPSLEINTKRKSSGINK